MKFFYDFIEEREGIEELKEQAMKSSTNMSPVLQAHPDEIRAATLQPLRQVNVHRQLTAADIGWPTNFRHVAHIGWNPEMGYDFENVDEVLGELLQRAGITKQQMEDKDTRNFVYDFMEEHGGLEEVKWQGWATSTNTGQVLQAHSEGIEVAIVPPSSRVNGQRQLTTADIGRPTNFRHVAHVGWDQSKGYDFENADEVLGELLRRAGITKQQMKDKDTMKFVYDFIEEHGGLEKVKRQAGTPSTVPAHHSRPPSEQSMRRPPIPTPRRLPLKSSGPLPPSGVVP